jgi:AcrR family transcriptional regulator
MPKMTAQQRRAQLIAVAFEEFAKGGLANTSAESITRRAGITQPYLFRLFGSKKALFLLVVSRCFARMREEFLDAAADLKGRDAIAAMGRRYDDILRDRTFLLVQLHSFAACDDVAVREVVRREFGLTWHTVQTRCGLDAVEIKRFMATGMLLNVAAAMDLSHLDEPWARACSGPVAGETAVG